MWKNDSRACCSLNNIVLDCIIIIIIIVVVVVVVVVVAVVVIIIKIIIIVIGVFVIRFKYNCMLYVCMHACDKFNLLNSKELKDPNRDLNLLSY